MVVFVPLNETESYRVKINSVPRSYDSILLVWNKSSSDENVIEAFIWTDGGKYASSVYLF